MKIEITHVAVYVKDLEAAKEYYTNYFGGISNNLYQNTKGFSSYFISFGASVRLELMRHDELQYHVPVDKASGYSHVAFSVGSIDAVIELTNKIVQAGFELYSPPRQTGDGYFESCVADPDGNRVEITI